MIEKNRRLSIRTRFIIVLLALAILPFLAYRFAIDLHQTLVKNQTIIQKQTVINLSLILENRTDLWSKQIQANAPINQFSHLILEDSVLWIVNENGLTNYVVGHLPLNEDDLHKSIFIMLGKSIIELFTKIQPFSLHYSYPQTAEPEKTLFENSIKGKTFQQYRMNKRGNLPYSLMSSSPLHVNDKIIGVLVLEQKMSTLIDAPLNTFYKLVGLGSLVFLLVIFGAIAYIGSLSNRIVRLDKDVRQVFKHAGEMDADSFPDRYKRSYHDEISDLRHHIYDMLQQLSSYERYLKQFPKALRHELHNPLNRLSMALTLLGQEVENKQLNYALHAVDQLKQIISSLTEATSIEDSLQIQTPEPFPVKDMLENYFENIISLNPGFDIKANINLPSGIQVLGDGFMVEQLLDKLLGNAKDFTNHKTPILIQVDQRQKMVTIRIQNSGRLIPRGFEKRIFDGMTNLRKPNEDNQTHLGLGLYIVKLISDYHHGRVTAINSLDNPITEHNGVVFEVSLPIIQ